MAQFVCVILTWVVSEYGSHGFVCQFVCVILTWVVSEYGAVCVCNFDMGCV